MNAGQLDRRITIEKKQVTIDETFGTEVVTWSHLATLWAQIQDVLPSRSESVQMGLAVARNQTRIRFRWRSDVDSSMRVTVHMDSGDVVHQIVGGPAEIFGRKKFLEVVCERYSS